LQPTNGALYFTGMDIPATAEVLNNHSPIQSFTFNFSTNQLPGLTTNGVEFTTTLTNIERGDYIMQAAMTNVFDVGFLSDPVSFTVVDITGIPGPAATNSLAV